MKEPSEIALAKRAAAPTLTTAGRTYLPICQATATLTKITFGSFLFSIYVAEMMWCWTLANAFTTYTPLDSLFLVNYQLKFFTYAAASLLLCMLVYSCYRISLHLLQSSNAIERPKDIGLPKDKRTYGLAVLAIALLFIPFVRAMIMPKVIIGLLMTMVIVFAVTINFALVSLNFFHSLSETKHWLFELQERNDELERASLRGQQVEQIEK